MSYKILYIENVTLFFNYMIFGQNLIGKNIVIFILFYLDFDQYIYLKTDTKIYTYTLYHYNIIDNIGRAALEQAYRCFFKRDINYIYIHLCTKSISIKV